MIIETLKMTYGNKENVRKEIEKIEKNDFDSLWKKLDEVKEKIAKINENQKNCKFDYAYWGYEAEYEELRTIKEYIEELLLDLVCEKLPQVYKIREKSEQLNHQKNKIKNQIENLKLYKPNGYKTMIRILEEI